jgi:hypothetical protein
MKTRLVMITGAAALALAGCEPPHPHHHSDAVMRTIDSLDCPDSQGDLTRKSQSADGKSCDYTDHAGSDVTLQLVALNGQDAKAALSPIETDLKGELPAGAGQKSDAGDGEGRVDIDLPGIHIHASGKDNADINVGGDASGGAHAAGGSGISIDAHDKDAQVSINETGRGIHMSYILASDSAGPNGYKVIGYEARGPQSGPLAVVTIKSKSDDADDLRDDARELLRVNVGG